MPEISGKPPKSKTPNLFFYQWMTLLAMPVTKASDRPFWSACIEQSSYIDLKKEPEKPSCVEELFKMDSQLGLRICAN